MVGPGRINHRQLKALLEHMKRERNSGRMVRGRTNRIKARKKWKMLARILNSIRGGGVRSADGWRKIWLSWNNKRGERGSLPRRRPTHTRNTNASKNLTYLERRISYLMGANMTAEDELPVDMPIIPVDAPSTSFQQPTYSQNPQTSPLASLDPSTAVSSSARPAPTSSEVSPRPSVRSPDFCEATLMSPEVAHNLEVAANCIVSTSNEASTSSEVASIFRAVSTAFAVTSTNEAVATSSNVAPTAEAAPILPNVSSTFESAFASSSVVASYEAAPSFFVEAPTSFEAASGSGIAPYSLAVASTSRADLYTSRAESHGFHINSSTAALAVPTSSMHSPQSDSGSSTVMTCSNDTSITPYTPSDTPTSTPRPSPAHSIDSLSTSDSESDNSSDSLTTSTSGEWHNNQNGNVLEESNTDEEPLLRNRCNCELCLRGFGCQHGTCRHFGCRRRQPDS